MKMRINAAIILALAILLIGTTLAMAQHLRREPMVLPPGRKDRVTSTAPPEPHAWPPTVPRARCTAPITGRSTRSFASRMARL